MLIRNLSMFTYTKACVVVAVLALAWTTTAHAQIMHSPLDGPAMTEAPAKTFATEAARWDAFSENIEVALASDHDGLETGALQQIIRYGDKLDLNVNAPKDVLHNGQRHAALHELQV